MLGLRIGMADPSSVDLFFDKKLLYPYIYSLFLVLLISVGSSCFILRIVIYLQIQ